MRRGKFLLYHWRLCGSARAARDALTRLAAARRRARRARSRVRRRRHLPAIRVRRGHISVARRLRHDLRERIDRGAQRAARHVVRRGARLRGSIATPFARISTRPSRTFPACRSRAGTAVASCTFDVEADDVRRLAEAPPFAWSTLPVRRRSATCTCTQQDMAAAAGKNVGDVGWTGREIVAIRLHLPSKIEYHKLRRQTTHAATSSSGSSRSPIGCAARRCRSTRACRRNRFCIARCGCSPSRSWPSPSRSRSRSGGS